MPERFLLRLENGPRAGETIEIPVSGLLVGRRAGNDLRLEDPSLSGRHALLRADGDSVQVEDLGSTNGTRVDGSKIERATAAAGSVVMLGKVELTILVGEAAASPPAPEPDSPGDEAVGFELEDEIVLGEPEAPAAPAMPALRIEAEAQSAPTTPAPPTPVAVPAPAPEPVDAEPALELDVEEALSRGGGFKVLPLALFVGLIGVGAWFLLREGPQAADELAPEVTEITGNRMPLAAFSFEAEEWATDVWSHDEAAPRRLALRRDASTSGRFGVGFEPEPGEWARLSSRWFAVRAGEPVRAAARAFAEPGANAWVALEFAASGDDAEPVRIVSEDAGVDVAELSVTSTVPQGRERARVVLVAGATEGRSPQQVAACGFDDVFFGAGAADQVRRVDEDESSLELDATDGVSLTFDRLGRRLGVLRVAAGSDPLGAHLPLSLGELRAESVDVRFAGQGSDAILRVDLHPELFGNGGRSVGCLSAAGFREYSGEFEAKDVDGVLIGGGLDQLLVSLPAPTRVIGGPRGEGLRIDVALGGERGFGVQLGFTEDRGLANTLAAKARRAERDGELGRSLARWQELLTRYPFETELVREAEVSVGRLSEQGLEQLRAVEGDLERAAFFRLGELFDECELSALAVADRFADEGGGSNVVEERAAELIGRIAAQRASLPMQGEQLIELRRETVRGFLTEAGHQGIVDALRASAANREER